MAVPANEQETDLKISGRQRRLAGKTLPDGNLKDINEFVDE